MSMANTARGIGANRGAGVDIAFEIQALRVMQLLQDGNSGYVLFTAAPHPFLSWFAV